MATVSFTDVDKIYGDGTQAVFSLNLTIEDGQFMVLVGPSGCGKTTALRMVAGLEEISAGTIEIGGERVNDLDPRSRDVAMVFQNYALYPSMTVADNIGFGLRMRKTPKKVVKARVEEIAGILGLTEHLGRRPGALSGGQRQRVAMGRAIVRRPRVFLMDEPLSNLDAKLRTQMRSEVARIQRDLQATTIYVTHDQVEAMTMGTHVAVMRKGRLQQVAEPQTLYERPVNLFVASFIGSPPMTLVEGVIAREGAALVCRVGPDTLSLPPETLSRHPGLEQYDGRRVGVGVRPESVTERTSESADVIHGKVTTTELLGSVRLVHAQVAAAPVITAETREVAADADAAVVTMLERNATENTASLLASFSPKSNPTPGENIALAVDTRELHLFDLETEGAIGAPAVVV